MDLIIAGYVWADKKHFYLYVLVAAVGSALGGLVPFLLGRAGGELFLMKRIDRARYEQLPGPLRKAGISGHDDPFDPAPAHALEAFCFRGRGVRDEDQAILCCRSSWAG